MSPRSWLLLLLCLIKKKKSQQAFNCYLADAAAAEKLWLRWLHAFKATEKKEEENLRTKFHKEKNCSIIIIIHSNTFKLSNWSTMTLLFAEDIKGGGQRCFMCSEKKQKMGIFSTFHMTTSISQSNNGGWRSACLPTLHLLILHQWVEKEKKKTNEKQKSNKKQHPACLCELWRSFYLFVGHIGKRTKRKLKPSGLNVTKWLRLKHYFTSLKFHFTADLREQTRGKKEINK